MIQKTHSYIKVQKKTLQFVHNESKINNIIFIQLINHLISDLYNITQKIVKIIKRRWDLYEKRIFETSC